MYYQLAAKVSTPLSKNVQIVPKVPIICVATIIFSTCASSYEEASFWDDSPAEQFDACSLRTNRLTPHLLYFSWHHSYIYFQKTTSRYDAEHVDSTSLADYARPVLSGTCPVKPLYGPSQHAAAQFQSAGSLLLGQGVKLESLRADVLQLLHVSLVQHT
ncbi:hypothetical protein ATANTOWER_013956 [Ataeniobius toweri]|uniref:Uncharacterized protein n=1 Tax=Ataeniobius toweri TaxID=208326 RepID=A0ABU7AF21_9TELE|nr:hypothetical protein [Ataeniobius toweri]